MYLMRGDEALRMYRVSLGPNPRGPKIFSGDGRTPEGLYTLERRNENSRFYRSFRISYPSYADMSRAYQYGGSPGGAIMVHGQPKDHFGGANPYFDWTEGCIALSNREMDEFMLAVTEGTPIEILP
jgi:murein L,D-transpeptidase YafK